MPSRFANSISIYPGPITISSGTVPPENVVTASPGSKHHLTTDGREYRKATGTGNTGWIEQTAGGAASTNEFPGPVKVVNTNGYVLQAGEAGGLVLYDVSGTAGTYFLPAGVLVGYTVSVSQGWSGQLTVAAAGSAGPDGIRTPTGIFAAVKTKSSGSILKFVRDPGSRWYLLPYGDSYVI